jgi:hypothetical protein
MGCVSGGDYRAVSEILAELQASQDRKEQIKKAGLSLNRKLIKAALALPGQRERDERKRKKQESPPA